MLRGLGTVEFEVDGFVNEMDGRLGILAGEHGEEGTWQCREGPEGSLHFCFLL
jgi:hypothetical protein